MTTRREVNRLRSATQNAVKEAQADLAGFFATWDLSTPERVREGLLEVVPALVNEYGDVAATAAAEWYEEVRASQVGGFHYARPGALPDPERVAGSVRWAAGELFGDNPEQTLALLSGAVQRHITYSARDTIAREASRDPRRPRAARVPGGSRTCAWCLMLAARGFIYHSRASAGGAGDEYHDECACQIVVSFDRQAAHIEGYDPDALNAMYAEARRSSGGTTDRQIAAELRRLFPDSVTDAVHEH